MTRSPSPTPKVHLARHGETEWSKSGQHTGRTDVPLTSQGEIEARALGQRLQGISVTNVWSSPLVRARRTCELAGFGASVHIDPDLAEWDYGAYEGRSSSEILAENPDWNLWRDGCPNGESPAAIGVRVDRVLDRLRALDGDCLIFSHGHFLRVLGARWLGLPPSGGRYLLLSTATLSTLGYEHGRLDEPVLQLWNESR